MKNRPPRRVLYIDETGHSGSALFDSMQPYFWLGAALVPENLDASCREAIRTLAKTNGVRQLHAKELGTAGVEKIARNLRYIVRRHRIKFVFARAEKRHLARLKLFDTVFDSGLNPIVPYYYYFGGLRLPFAHDVIALIESGDEEIFWRAYESLNSQDFITVLRRLAWNIRNRMLQSRAKAIALDALRWAETHPKEVFSWKRTPADSPNVTLIGSVMETAPRWGKVVRVIHHQQNEFEKSLAQAFEIHRLVRIERGHLGTMRPVERQDIVASCMEFASTVDAEPLQIVDCCNWLVRRNYPVPDPNPPPETARLLREVILQSPSHDLSAEQLARSASEIMARIGALPLSEADEHRAREVIAAHDKERRRHMERE